jgi:uncharacterized membrane protein YgaE (UPF0421/DUF939 family)
MRASASPAFLNPSVNRSNCHYSLGILLLVVTASSVYPPITATAYSGYVISSIVKSSTLAYKINSLFSLLIGVGLSFPAFLTPLIPASPSPGYVDQVSINSDSTYSFSPYIISTTSCTMNAHERKAIKRKERRLNPVSAEAAAIEDARRETANEQRRIRRAAARDRHDYTERDANTVATQIRRAAAQSRNDKTEQDADTARRRLVRRDADRREVDQVSDATAGRLV